jgi:hypothetical protein
MGVRVVRVDVDKDDAVSSGTIISAETAQEMERLQKALAEEKQAATEAADGAEAEQPTAEPAAEPAAEVTPEPTPEA